jgi:hypothetical protein
MANQHANENLDKPEFLGRAPRTPEELIAMGAEMVADYLDPSISMSAEDLANRIVELFDNPTGIEAYEREMARRAGVERDVDSWH